MQPMVRNARDKPPPFYSGHVNLLNAQWYVWERDEWVEDEGGYEDHIEGECFF
jgi:hypothetical protein